MNHTRKSDLERVVVIGSGNWGSAIARIAAMNAKQFPHQFEQEVVMWVFEEMFEGQSLTALINQRHENPKYLPGIALGDNVRAEADMARAVKDATALVIVLPHQFLGTTLRQLKNHINPAAKAVTLIKGFSFNEDTKQIKTFATVIREELGISVCALSGANIANEVAQDKYSESTLGIPISSQPQRLDEREETILWKNLFQTPSFRIHVVEDVEGVCLGGALKNVVALAAGFIDGLGWGDNAKAAVMRQGLMEIHDFCLEYFPTTQSSTFLTQSCGIADIMTSCMGGRNRMVAMQMVKTGKTFQQLESELLNGQKLQGPMTADEMHSFMLANGTENLQTKFPLITNVWRICFEGMEPKKLVGVRIQPRL